ncbi:MAG: hypothetical protein ACOCZ8_01270 [Bacteroidota bacterium]
MTLAIGTLILIVLIAPGFAFRRLYFSGYFSNQYFKSSTSEVILATIFPAIATHLLTIELVEQLDYTIDWHLLTLMLSGNESPEQQRALTQTTENQKWRVAGYLMLSISIAGALGLSVKTFVRGTKLDRKQKIFRYRNEWHYFFTGEYLDLPGVPGESIYVKLKYVDVLVSSSAGDLIYSGLLADYVLSSDGGLDRIYLHDVKRRYLIDDAQETSQISGHSLSTSNKYYALPGDVLMLPYSEMKNIHVRFYTLPEFTTVVAVENSDSEKKNK